MQHAKTAAFAAAVVAAPVAACTYIMAGAPFRWHMRQAWAHASRAQDLRRDAADSAATSHHTRQARAHLRQAMELAAPSHAWHADNHTAHAESHAARAATAAAPQACAYGEHGAACSVQAAWWRLVVAPLCAWCDPLTDRQFEDLTCVAVGIVLPRRAAMIERVWEEAQCAEAEDEALGAKLGAPQEA
jgi:hypothetical protein